MMRRRSVGLVVAISVIAAVVGTLAVVFAVQTIFGTKTAGAKATVVTLARNIRVCPDVFCNIAQTADLNFGEIASPGGAKPVEFFIKNTEEVGAGAIFVDFRIRTGDQTTPLSSGDKRCSFSGAPGCRILTGDVLKLGGFEVWQNFEETFPFTGSDQDNPALPMAGQDVRRVRIIWKAVAGLKEGPIAFQILLDVVDKVE